MTSHNFTAKDIHLRIRNTRTELGYSQEFVASKIGISQNAYSRIELGLAKLSIERMLKIADILQVNPLQFLTADEK